MGFLSLCFSYLKVEVTWHVLRDRGWSSCYHTCLDHVAFPLETYSFQVSASLNASAHWYSRHSKTKSLDPIIIPHSKMYSRSTWLHCPPIQKRKPRTVWFGFFFLVSACWMSHHQNSCSSSSGSACPPLHHSSFPSSQHYTITRPPHTNVYCYFGCLDIRLGLAPPQQIFCFISNGKTLLDRYSFKWTFLIIQYLALHQMQT